MTKLAKFFIDNYKFTFVLSIGVLTFGLFGLARVNSESYPAVDFAMATVTTSYDGASAEDIETRISKPIEDEVRTVSGLKDVRSVSQPGLSTVLIRADIDGADVEKVMAELQRAIDRVTDLPADLKDRPKFTEIKSEEFPVIEIAVVGSNDERKRDIVSDLLKEEIEDNKSVLNARLTGHRERAFQISLDVDKMRARHIGIDEVLAKIQTRNQNIPGGKLQAQDDQRLVRIEGKIENREDIDNIVVRSNFSGRSILLKDIATIEDSEVEAKVLSHYEGRPATLIVVRKKGGTDTIEMVDDINSKLEVFSKTYPDFEFIVYNNEALRVKNKLGVLSSNAVSGLILVVFFLLLFLPGRIGLMASLSLPLAVLATMGFIPVLDMNLNAITILALVIALGMLVDNSVVISENYARLRGEGHLPNEAAMLSIRQLWLPITATVFTTIAAFLPMLVTKGIMGQFIKYIPIIVTIALLISLVESFFFLPMRLLAADPKVKMSASKSASWFDAVANRFEIFMRFVIKHRYAALLVYLGMLFGSIVMMTKYNDMILFPADQTEIYVGRLELEKGTTLEDTKAYMSKLSIEIKETSGEYFDHIITRVGAAKEGPIDPKGKDGDNVGILHLYATDNTKNNISDAEVLGKLRDIAVGPKVRSLTFDALVNGPPVGEPVNVTFRSNDDESLDAVVSGVVKTLEATEGIRDVKVDDVFGDDQVYVDVNYAQADRLGLNVQSIGNAVRAAISGKVASKVNLDNKEVDLVVRLKEKARLSPDDLKRVEIMDSRGNLIPLYKVAKVRQEAGKPQIKRFDYKRARTVTANVVEGKMTAIVANQVAQDAYDEMKVNYADVSLVFGGEGQNTKESMDSLWSALVLSLIGIFALLVFLFNSILRPFIIMTTIPLGLVGFSIAFALHQRPISFLALIGVIGLGGIIVNSGIILITFIDQLREEGVRLFEALAKASRLRLRAVVVSSLTTISGLLPTAYGIGGSDSLLIPMTLAMAWGLTSGTILTIVWVPCAYAIIEDFLYIVNTVFQFLKRTLNRILGRSTVEIEPQASEAEVGKGVAS